MIYSLKAIQDSLLFPIHLGAQGMKSFLFPEAHSPYAHRFLYGMASVLERFSRSFAPPCFGIDSLGEGSEKIHIQEVKKMSLPFCDLIHFEKTTNQGQLVSEGPTLLIVAPLSGHFATLLRDTVRSFIPRNQVYISYWKDAADIPLKEGYFHFDTYVDYLLKFIRSLGPQVHLLAVCQPSVPVLCAVSLLAQGQDSALPASMILMGGPIDTRINPGLVNRFAARHSLEWIRNTLIDTVPLHRAGAGRRVCPGFMMLAGFMGLGLDRHRQASLRLFDQLIQSPSSSQAQRAVRKHMNFYDEYRSVLDMDEGYFLDSLRIAFQDHSLAKGTLLWKDILITPRAIHQTALLTLEGEFDDISPPGQTQAAHSLCSELKETYKRHYLQKNVGHYGLFSGQRWRTLVHPRIEEFIHSFEKTSPRKKI